MKYQPIAEVVNESLSYIEDRSSRKIVPLKTRWKKFNDLIDGGMEWGNLYTLAGISGSGKSAFANLLETDLFDLNPKEKFKVLSFNFEMAAYRQILRKFSNKVKRTVGELKSSNYTISKEEMDTLYHIGKEISLYDISYIDVPEKVGQVKSSILDFQKDNPSHRIFIILDHSRLARKNNSQTEQGMLDEMCNMFTEIKKRLGCSILLLSQLNREIESRSSTPSMHYPVRSDLFGSDSLYQHSDYVFVIHRPDAIGIRYYGPDRIDAIDRIFLHTLKNRDGDTKIITMTNGLKYNLIEEE